MESLSTKTMVVLLKRGGKIWVTGRQAAIASEAKLSGEGVVDIDGQLVDVADIRGVVNAETYQGTNEKKLERENYQIPGQSSRSNCSKCQGYRFTLEEPYPPNALYGAAAVPCVACNPNPPKLSW